MGISKQVVKALLLEDAFRPIAGQWLSFGRQTVNVDNDILAEVCGAALVSNLSVDAETRHGSGRRVSDRALIEGLFAVDYRSVDKSDYEGADIVTDLSQPVDQALEGGFDFVFTGGCLDNVFSPADLIRNSSRLLRPGGRVMHYESASRLLGAFSYLTAEWFLSYYAVNRFVDCKVFLLTQTQPGRDRFHYDVDVFKYGHEFTRSDALDYFEAACALPGLQYLLVLAEKGEDSTDSLIPDQLQYLDENSVDWRVQAKLYENSARPLVTGPTSKTIDRPFHSDHYEYRGSGY